MSLLTSAAFAQDKPAEPENAQETAIRNCIKQLGDNDWKTRETAAEELKKIGEPALPFLKELQASKDADLSARAEELIKAIEGASPIKHEVKIATPQGMPKQDLVFSAPEGITIEVTEKKDDKEDTQTHKFASEEELEKKSPHLAKVYKKRFAEVAKKQEALRKQFSEMTGIP
jgi:HEAT repeat protein